MLYGNINLVSFVSCGENFFIALPVKFPRSAIVKKFTLNVSLSILLHAFVCFENC